MPDQQTEMTRGVRQTSTRDFLRVLFRHKWKIVIFFLTACGTVTVMTVTAPSRYRSEAKILLRLGRESVALDPTATTGTEMLPPAGRTREGEMETEIQILKSPTVARRVVEEVGPEAFRSTEAKAIHPIQQWIDQLWPSSGGSEESLDAKEETITNLMQALSAEVPVNAMASIINLAYTSPDPEFAQQVLGKTIDAYLVEHVAVNRTPGSYEFFVQQYDLAKTRLETLQSELAEIKKKAEVSSFDEQIRLALARRDGLRENITQLESSMAASTARINKLKAALEGLPETVVTQKTTAANPAADTARGRLDDLKLQLEDLLSTYEESNREIQNLRRQIQMAEEMAKQEDPTRTEVTVAANNTRKQIEELLLQTEANRLSDEAQVLVLKKELEGVQAELQRLNEADVRIKNLTREIGIEEDKYQKYSVSREEARIEQAMQSDKISNICVLQAATLPALPTGASKSLLITLGILVGLVGAVSIAFVAEHMDHSIQTPDDVEERLHLPTLASVPWTRNHTIGTPRGRRSLLGFIGRNRLDPSAQWVLPQSIRAPYELLGEAVALNYESNGTTSSYGEQDTDAVSIPIDEATKQGSRKTRAKVHKSRMVGVVGPQGGEGVSVVAANLATTLANHGRVLLVDANASHPCAHEIFGMKVSLGLVDILTDPKNWQRAIGKTPVANLDLMPMGTAPGNTCKVDMGQFQRIFGLMGKQYDYIIVDMPPVSEVGYSGRLASLCDHVGLVVEAERSRWEVVQRTKEQLERVHANISGVVLNKRQYHIPEWLYRTL